MLSKEETLEKINVSLPSYTKEKIHYAGDLKVEKKEEILKKILQMRRLSSEIYYNPNIIGIDYFKIRNYIFLEQAKLMVDVVDNYEPSIFPEYSYFWTYESLEIPELRTYFTWRTRIRKQEYPKVATGYILIYLSELINLIGVSNEEEAFVKIVEVINHYYKDVPELYFKRVFQNIPKDFIINYHLPVEKLKMVQIEDEANKDDQAKLKIYKKDYHNILPFLSKNASYKVLNSQFYTTKYGFLIERAIPEVFKKLEEFFHEYKIDFSRNVLGKKQRISSYRIFSSLAHFERRENYSSHTVISEIEEYDIHDKICSAYLYELHPNSRILLGIILKQIESRIREKTGYKRKIKVNLNELDKLPIRNKKLRMVIEEEGFLDKINEIVDSFLKEQQKEIKKEFLDKRKSEIVVDSGLFDEIRKSTERIQEKLLTEEEKEETLEELQEEVEEAVEIKFEEIPEQESIVEMGMEGLLKSLTELEMTILKSIINYSSRSELENIAKEKMSLLEVIIENINLKSLDYIGDNLIEDLISEVSIYEDYMDDIKTELEKMEV